jgi:hypothetical protein
MVSLTSMVNVKTFITMFHAKILGEWGFTKIFFKNASFYFSQNFEGGIP